MNQMAKNLFLIQIDKNHIMFPIQKEIFYIEFHQLIKNFFTKMFKKSK